MPLVRKSYNVTTRDIILFLRELKEAGSDEEAAMSGSLEREEEPPGSTRQIEQEIGRWTRWVSFGIPQGIVSCVGTKGYEHSGCAHVRTTIYYTLFLM